MNTNLLLAAVATACLALPFSTSAQRQRPPQIESPIVHPDRTVTFNLRVPNAKKVEVSTQFTRGNQELKQDTNGVWTVTLGPAEPNLYPYNFIVDGVAVADPNNLDVFPNERFKSSMVDIPGDKPALHAAQNVPHGDVTYCYYPSAKFGIRPLIVYTPPGYRDSAEKYPVFYLVSGTTDTEETWFKVGRVNFILDNLIAQKKAVPMVVVMPYGNMMSGTPDPTTPQAADMYKVFTDELVGGIMPYVEGHYRVSSDRTKRAIAGFSRGGGQSLFAGFSNLDKFAWIGSYSAYLTPEVFNKHFSPLAEKPETANQQLKLLWLGVGTEDFLYRQAVTFDEFLTEKKIEHKSLVTGGGHTWMNARHYLTETLQLYFK